MTDLFFALSSQAYDWWVDDSKALTKIKQGFTFTDYLSEFAHTATPFHEILKAS